VPPRVKLLSQFNELSQGVKFLVDLRAELMMFAAEDIRLQALDADIHALLGSWFDIGFLDLKRITWETPATLLEKLIEYEAVHAIKSWDDLKNRLGDDRRCYAYFHPRMPDEPLIFVEVALVKGISDNVQEVLDEDAPSGDPEDADTAIFYSISNCHLGLAGINFGNFLIKRVADDLTRDLPKLKTFATLSPIPGFRDWIREHASGGQMTLFDEGEFETLQSLTGEADPIAALESLLEQPDWMNRTDLTAVYGDRQEERRLVDARSPGYTLLEGQAAVQDQRRDPVPAHRGQGRACTGVVRPPGARAVLSRCGDLAPRCRFTEGDPLRDR